MRTVVVALVACLLLAGCGGLRSDIPVRTPTNWGDPTPSEAFQEVAVGEWGNTSHAGNPMAVVVERVDRPETVAGEAPPEGTDWVVAEVRLVSGDGPPVFIGYDQWRAIDGLGRVSLPDDGAMAAVDGAYPEEVQYPPGTDRRYTVVWALERHEDAVFEVVPYGTQGGEIVRIVPPAPETSRPAGGNPGELA